MQLIAIRFQTVGKRSTLREVEKFPYSRMIIIKFFLLQCDKKPFICCLIATCLRDGIEVQKSSVNCEIKTGCRRIQKTGECCPEYQCGMSFSTKHFFSINAEILL